MKKQYLVTFVGAGILLFGFQNCGAQFQFKDSGNAVAADENTNHVFTVSQDPPNSPLATNLTNSQTHSETQGSNTKSADENDLIECELGAPNMKITFSQDLEVGSNAAQSRVCMSEHACLNIINAYAAARDCQMSLGPATKASHRDCTEVFPGSKGTCHNAQSVSDDQVIDLLNKMAK